MSVGGGKAWRRWRHVGTIMSKRYDRDRELKDRFGQKPNFIFRTAFNNLTGAW